MNEPYIYEKPIKHRRWVQPVTLASLGILSTMGVVSYADITKDSLDSPEVSAMPLPDASEPTSGPTSEPMAKPTAKSKSLQHITLPVKAIKPIVQPALTVDVGNTSSATPSGSSTNNAIDYGNVSSATSATSGSTSSSKPSGNTSSATGSSSGSEREDEDDDHEDHDEDEHDEDDD